MGAGAAFVAGGGAVVVANAFEVRLLAARGRKLGQCDGRAVIAVGRAGLRLPPACQEPAGPLGKPFLELAGCQSRSPTSCVGRPFLVAAQKGDQAIDDWIEHFLEAQRAAVFPSGAKSCQELCGVPRIVGGVTRRWFDDLRYGITRDGRGS